MISGTTLDLDAGAVLADARAARREANAAEARLLARAVEWAHLHAATDLDDAATWWVGSKVMGQDTGIPIAGEGCPLVSEFAVAEFGTVLGIGQQAARHLVGEALELAHRLPKTWLQVQDGRLAPWRARRIAEQTLTLTPEAAAWVDDQVAPFASKTGLAQTQRLVQEAIAKFMPEHAAEQRRRAADQRHLTVEQLQVSFAGTVRIEGEVDLVDAQDFDDALALDAAQQHALGSVETLDVRRALAVGNLARRQLALEFPATALDQPGAADRRGTGTPSTTDCPSNPADAGDAGGAAEAGPFVRRGKHREREVVLHVHLTEEDLRSSDPDAPVRLDHRHGELLTAGQVAEWCGRPETRLTVKPVIDLNEQLHSSGYRPSPRLAEQVRLRDGSCVFPHCHRPARGCDLDHITAWDDDGPTETANLAALCRLHHRLKTHAGWTYTMVERGSFLWHSPYGYTYLRDSSGTEDLTPPPVDPPPRRTS